MKNTENIFILVRPDHNPEAYGSIKAIYDHLSPEEIGLPIHKVWGRFDERDTLDTGRVLIYKTTIKRRKRNENGQI